MEALRNGRQKELVSETVEERKKARLADDEIDGFSFEARTTCLKTAVVRTAGGPRALGGPPAPCSESLNRVKNSTSHRQTGYATRVTSCAVRSRLPLIQGRESSIYDL